MHAVEDVELVTSPVSEAHTDILSPSTLSMVTVRLSDSEPSETVAEPELQHDNVHNTGRTGLSTEEFDFAQTPKSATDPGELEISQSKGMAESRRISAGSSSSEEHDGGAILDIDRSRRGSSSTTSSNSSTRVDWEELEKTEEQEPRAEGSDEVYLHHLNCPAEDSRANLHSPLPFSSLGSNKRITHLRRIQNRVCQSLHL